jgi:AcrR family transcriptional regulator
MVDDSDASPGADDAVIRVVGLRREPPSRRDRIIEALIEVMAERGYAGASVALVCARARVSRRTFYESFPSFEECFLAILDRGLEVMTEVMSRAFASEGDWLDGLLAAEAGVLCYLDSEPQLARVLMVEALGAGAWAFARRQQHVEALRELIVEQLRDSPVGGDFPPLVSIGVMASLMGMVQDHLLRDEPEPLISLLGPFMGVITTPYLPPEAVAREIHRGEKLAERIQAGGARPAPSVRVGEEHATVPLKLDGVSTRRVRECLLFLLEQGEQGLNPSNREIAVGIGVGHQSQISRLLAHLLPALVTHLQFPSGHRKRIRTTNLLERTFVEVRRRTKVIGRFPGETSALSLIWAVLELSSRGWRGVKMNPQNRRRDRTPTPPAARHHVPASHDEHRRGDRRITSPSSGATHERIHPGNETRP